MIGLLHFVLGILASPFKSKSRLEVENAVLRHQLIVLRRKIPGRPRLTNSDRWFFIQLYRWFPSILQVLTIVRPETGWRTFLRNHAPNIAAMDLFVVPTLGFDLLYAFVIVRPRPQRPGVDQRHSKPDGQMGCTSNNGGISLG